MSLDKKSFYGKEVADAIKAACEELNVPQERLDIEVIKAGSSGIFGLIRKKAHIKVALRPEEESVDEADAGEEPAVETVSEEVVEKKPAAKKKKAVPVTDEPAAQQPVAEQKVVEDVGPEALAIVQGELETMLELMGYPSTVEVSSSGTAVSCHISSDHEEALTGEEGKTLDSLQYLLRKIVARKIPDRLRLAVDVGDFRERRLSELKERALALAEMVKEDGKTQLIPALNPSERRIVHMALQEDKEIRSRSVGDGLFKKILIFKPGKGKKNSGRRRPHPRNRKKSNKPSAAEKE